MKHLTPAWFYTLYKQILMPCCTYSLRIYVRVKKDNLKVVRENRQSEIHSRRKNS